MDLSIPAVLVALFAALFSLLLAITTWGLLRFVRTVDTLTQDVGKLNGRVTDLEYFVPGYVARPLL